MRTLQMAIFHIICSQLSWMEAYLAQYNLTYWCFNCRQIKNINTHTVLYGMFICFVTFCWHKWSQSCSNAHKLWYIDSACLQCAGCDELSSYPTAWQYSGMTFSSLYSCQYWYMSWNFYYVNVLAKSFTFADSGKKQISLGLPATVSNLDFLI